MYKLSFARFELSARRRQFTLQSFHLGTRSDKPTFDAPTNIIDPLVVRVDISLMRFEVDLLLLDQITGRPSRAGNRT